MREFFICQRVFKPLCLAVFSVGFFSICPDTWAEGDEFPPFPSPGRAYDAPPGPWGQLQYYVTHLRIPKSHLEYFSRPSEVTEWYFDASKREEARDELVAAGVPISKLGWITNQPAFVIEETLKLLPPGEFLENLTPAERACVSRVLGRNEANSSHHNRVAIPYENPEDWWKHTGVNEETAELLARYSFPLGQTNVFADYSLVLSQISSVEEEKNLLRAMTATPSLIVRLKLDDRSDLDSVADYWSGGAKKKAILPILESIANNPEVDWLDVTHLLPPLPRRLLYTYPSLEMGSLGRFPDCHWTSLNFFRIAPKDRFLDVSAVAKELESFYDIVTTPLEFGDVVLVFDAEAKQALHSAVYIAADIVFTKNGGGLGNPWVLMPINQMLKVYGQQDSTGIRYYRLR